MRGRQFAARVRTAAKRVDGECARHMFIPLLLIAENLDVLSVVGSTNSHSHSFSGAHLLA